LQTGAPLSKTIPSMPSANSQAIKKVHTLPMIVFTPTPLWVHYELLHPVCQHCKPYNGAMKLENARALYTDIARALAEQHYFERQLKDHLAALKEGHAGQAQAAARHDLGNPAVGDAYLEALEQARLAEVLHHARP